MPDGQLEHRWPEPPPGPKAPRSVRAWRVLRQLHAAGWLRPRRVGCLLLVLVLLLFAAVWVMSSAVKATVAVFDPAPPPVPGSPHDTITPSRSPSSGSPTIDRITKRGWLIVAVDEAAGLAEGSPGEPYTGFDVELVQRVARALGVDPAKTEFKELPVALGEARVRDGGDVQLVVGGYQVTAQRRDEGRVAGPHLVSPLRLAVPTDSSVTSLDALGNGRICVAADSPAAAALAGPLGERLVTKTTLSGCAAQLHGPVQAIAGDHAALRDLPAIASGELRMVGEPLGSIEFGFGLPTGDEVFRMRITEVLCDAIEDGTWARLHERYLGDQPPTPPAIC